MDKLLTHEQVLEIAGENSEYAEIFRREHHGHPILQNRHGTLRWKPDPVIEMIMPGGEFDCLNLNLLFASGANKNDPRVRKLYRMMGYCLFGYWEVFHWKMNNEHADEYYEDDPMSVEDTPLLWSDDDLVMSDGTVLNVDLVKKQNLTLADVERIKALHEEKDRALRAAHDQIKMIEFQMQDAWKFERDETKHTWRFAIQRPEEY